MKNFSRNRPITTNIYQKCSRRWGHRRNQHRVTGNIFLDVEQIVEEIVRELPLPLLYALVREHPEWMLEIFFMNNGGKSDLIESYIREKFSLLIQRELLRFPDFH